MRLEGFRTSSAAVLAKDQYLLAEKGWAEQYVKQVAIMAEVLRVENVELKRLPSQVESHARGLPHCELLVHVVKSPICGNYEICVYDRVPQHCSQGIPRGM